MEQCRQAQARRRRRYDERSARWSRRPRSASSTVERRLFINTTVRLEGGRRDDDQLPSAAHDIADDDRRLRRRSLAPVVRDRDSPSSIGCSASATRCCSIVGRRRCTRSVSRPSRQTAAARTGIAHTARGSYRTPCFMPVGTRGAIKYLERGRLRASSAPRSCSATRIT